ncbi:hypothetical protein FYJ26_07880 [Anaerococcus sp. WCA-380-WT-2B]|uniref:Uncharacterized protein n=1 Tax=Anaerococcus porci TaxID=2652269 RepID=A0A6N7VFU8_9FIRM|nr:hypothetical protein [Anaerococcus porci]MSS78318.1 hypothetical protein [Anaerococcus porci]
MLNKRFRQLFIKNFREENLKYLPNTKVYGYPNDYVLRILLILVIYGFYLGVGFSIFMFLAFVYLKNGDEFSYFMSSSLVISFFALILSINDLITDYSRSKEITILRTMPIKESEIYLSKFFAKILSSFEVFLFYILMGIVYFYIDGFKAIRLIGYVINFLPMIVIPILLMSLIIMIIMRFSNIRSYSNIFKFIGYGISLLLIGFVYFYAFRSNSGDAFSKIGKIFISSDSILSYLFIHTRIYAKSLNASFISFIGYSLVLYLYFAILIFISEKISSKIYLDSFSELRQKKRHKKQGLVKSSQNSKIIAICRKDFKSLISTPVYVYPVLSSMIIFTIFWGFGASGFLDMIKTLDFSNKDLYLIFIIGGFVFRYFISANDVAINSSLSREGEGLYQTLTYPIAPRDNVLGRLISINLLNTILNIGLCIILSLLTKVDFLASLSLFIGFTLASLLSSMQGILMDSKSVNIHWEREKDLTRGSSANIGYYLASGIILLIVGVFSFLIYNLTNIYVAFLFIFILIILVIKFLYMACIRSYRNGFYDV